MNTETGEIREYAKVPSQERDNWSQPFHKNELIEFGHVYFRLTGWKSPSRLYAKIEANAQGDKFNPLKEGDIIDIKGLNFRVTSVKSGGRLYFKKE